MSTSLSGVTGRSYGWDRTGLIFRLASAIQAAALFITPDNSICRFSEGIEQACRPVGLRLLLMTKGI
jgi:hypothetical protein